MPTKIVVVMPAYNAELTLVKTLRDIPKDCVEEIILVDDNSRDNTVALARAEGIRVIEHGKTGVTAPIRRPATARRLRAGRTS